MWRRLPDGDKMKNIYNLAALIAARKKSGLSQADIAKKAEVKEKTVANFEQGKKPRSAWGHRLILAYQEIGGIKLAPVKKRQMQRRVARTPRPAADDLDDDGTMKPWKRSGKKALANERAYPSLNAEWLQAQIRAFISENDLTIVERGRSGTRTIVMTHDQVFDLGAVILLACGHNVRS
jgi:DNA-binding XRE family transcriptional regulator